MAISNEMGTYAAQEVIVTVGHLTVTGYVQGSFVKISKDSNSIEAVEGCDGTGGRSVTYGRLHTITLTLLSSAKCNSELSKLHTLDVVSGGRGMFPMTITDGRGDSVFSSAQAFISKTPDKEYSNTIGENEWEIKAFADPTSNFVGGNE